MWVFRPFVVELFLLLFLWVNGKFGWRVHITAFCKRNVISRNHVDGYLVLCALLTLVGINLHMHHILSQTKAQLGRVKTKWNLLSKNNDNALYDSVIKSIIIIDVSCFTKHEQTINNNLNIHWSGDNLKYIIIYQAIVYFFDKIHSDFLHELEKYDESTNETAASHDKMYSK